MERLLNPDIENPIHSGMKVGDGSWSNPTSEYEGASFSTHVPDILCPDSPLLNGGAGDVGGSIKPTSNGNFATRSTSSDYNDSSLNPTGIKIEGRVGPAVVSSSDEFDDRQNPSETIEGFKPDGSFVSFLNFLNSLWTGDREGMLSMSGVDGTGENTFHTWEQTLSSNHMAAAGFETWLIQYYNDINAASGNGASWSPEDWLSNPMLYDMRDCLLTWWYNNIYSPQVRAADDVRTGGTGGFVDTGDAGCTGGNGDTTAGAGDKTLSMAQLQEEISRLLSMLNGSDLTAFSANMLTFFETLSDYSDLLGLKSADAKVNFIQNIYNALAAQINTQLEALYDRQNWLFQSEYNNPINQMQRLMAAGINPAFYYSSLSKSNADAIGATNPSSPSSSPISDTSTNPLEKVGQIAGAVGSVGGIFNSGIGAAGALVQNVASAKFTDEQRIDLSETRPSRISQMFGAAAAAQAEAAYAGAQTPNAAALQESTIDANKSTALFNRSNARALWRSLELKKMEIDNALEIARMGNNTSLSVASISAAASRYAARLGYNASMSNLEGSTLVSLLQNMYDDIETTAYVDSQTGQTYSTEQLRQSAIESGYDVGTDVDLGVFGIQANGKASSKASKLSSFKNGQSFSFGGKQYQVTTRHRKEFDPARYRSALELYKPLWEGLKTGSVNNAQFNAGVSEIFGIVDDEQRKLLKSISTSFAGYHFNFLKNLNNK